MNYTNWLTLHCHCSFSIIVHSVIHTFVTWFIHPMTESLQLALCHLTFSSYSSSLLLSRVQPKCAYVNCFIAVDNFSIYIYTYLYIYS